MILKGTHLQIFQMSVYYSFECVLFIYWCSNLYSYRWSQLILAILFRPFGVIVPQNFKLFSCPIFRIWASWWRLFIIDIFLLQTKHHVGQKMALWWVNGCHFRVLVDNDDRSLAFCQDMLQVRHEHSILKTLPCKVHSHDVYLILWFFFNHFYMWSAAHFTLYNRNESLPIKSPLFFSDSDGYPI